MKAIINNYNNILTEIASGKKSLDSVLVQIQEICHKQLSTKDLIILKHFIDKCQIAKLNSYNHSILGKITALCLRTCVFLPSCLKRSDNVKSQIIEKIRRERFKDLNGHTAELHKMSSAIAFCEIQNGIAYYQQDKLQKLYTHRNGLTLEDWEKTLLYIQNNPSSKAKFVSSKKTGLARSLIYAPDGSIYVVLNKGNDPLQANNAKKCRICIDPFTMERKYLVINAEPKFLDLVSKEAKQKMAQMEFGFYREDKPKYMLILDAESLTPSK